MTRCKTVAPRGEAAPCPRQQRHQMRGHQKRSHAPFSLLAVAALLLLLVPAHAIGNSITSVDQDQDAGATVAEHCLHEGMINLYQSCSATRSLTSNAAKQRDLVISLMQKCLGQGNTSDTQGIRMLVSASVWVDILRPRLDLYRQVTGLPITFQSPPSADYTKVRLASVANSRNQSATHEAWLLSPTSLGDGVAAGAFKDVTDLVLLDNRLQWAGLLKSVRTTALLYNSKIVAMPNNAYTLLLQYRQDVFSRNGFKLPRTWDELVELAGRINGTEGLYGFCGSWEPCGQLGLSLIRQVLASHIQTHGAEQGWLIDPDSLELLLDSPVLVEAFNIIKALYNLSPQKGNGTCARVTQAFAQGQCLMTLGSGGTFKSISHVSKAATMKALQGNLGMALVPGSQHVLDRTTNKLVPCDETRCPSGIRYTNPDGTSMVVNVSPGFEGLAFAINKNLPADKSFYAYSVASYIASPETSDQLVFHPDSEILPTRTNQFNAQRWIAAGFNPDDTHRFVAAQFAALNHDNVNHGARMAGSSSISLALTSAANSLFSGQSNDTTELAQRAVNSTRAILATTNYYLNRTAFKDDYWASQNRAAPPVAPPPPQPVPPPFIAPTEQPAEGSGVPVLAIALGTALPCALAIAVLFWYFSTHSVGKAVSCPGSGSSTTILVSDIENSTLLWEALNSGVMDSAVKMHNTCLRQLAAKHSGYESAWEGDSFVIAFHSPRDALSFSLEAQTQLLLLPWPTALLASPQAGEVFVARRGKVTGNLVKSKTGALRPLPDSSLHTLQKSVTFTNNPFSAPDFLQTLATEPFPDGDEAHVTTKGGLGVRSASQGLIQREGQPAQQQQDGALLNSAPLLPPGKGLQNLGPRWYSSQGQIAHGGQQHSNSGRLSLAPPAVRLSRTFSKIESSIDQPSPVSQEQSLFGLETTQTMMIPVPGPWQPAGSSEQPCVTAFEAANSTHVLDCTRLGDVLEEQWRVVAPATPGAVLAYRGLRVRLGMAHVGSATNTGINYNTAMGRYHFSGTVRTAANAIASSAHGGQIVMSSTTMALAGGQDASGMLDELPANCHVYHMGTHNVQEIDEPVDIVLALPSSLRSRLAISQNALRNTQCTLAGVLSAIVPASASHSPVLVAVNACGIGTLMAWDAHSATVALSSMLLLASQEARAYHGVVSEDGISIAMYLGKVAGNGSGVAGKKLGMAQAACTPGQLIVAFRHAPDALHFALGLRNQMLRFDWDPELLTQPVCEQVGSVSSIAAATTTGGQWTQAQGAPSLIDTLLSTSPDLVQFWKQRPEETRAETTGQALSPDALSLRPAPRQWLGGLVGGLVGKIPRASHSGKQPAVRKSGSGEEAQRTSNSGLYAPRRSSNGYSGPRISHNGAVSGNVPHHMSGAGASSSSHDEPSQVGSTAEDRSVQASKEPRSFERLRWPQLSREMMISTSGDYATVPEAKETVRPKVGAICELDAPVLRGIRTRTVLVDASKAQARVSKRGSGRMIYSGKATKQMAQLMRLAKPGQILLPASLIDRLQGVYLGPEDAARLALAASSTS